MLRTSRKRQLYDCDRCMFTYKKSELRKQRGMLLCSACFDNVLEIAPLNIRFRSPRENSTTLTVVNSPTVFTVSSTGLSVIAKSQTFVREGVTHAFVMFIQGTTGGSVIQSLPDMPAGTLLTLSGKGTIPISVLASSSIDVVSNCDLYEGSTLSFVYSGASSKWVETSRFNVLDTGYGAVPAGALQDDDGNYIKDDDGNYIIGG